MGLIEQIGRLLRRPAEAPGARQTTSDETPRPARPLALSERLRAETDRRAVVRTCREMYWTDGRAEQAISTLARDMVRGGFTVAAPANPEAEQIAADLVRRLSLEQRLDDWTRLTLRDGDTFLELGIDRNRQIAKVTRKPTLQMHRACDDFDEFPEPERAFWQAEETWLGTGVPMDAIWYAEWQVIHARWRHDEGERYGRPLFASGTAPWRRVKEGEIDIAVRRKTRSGLKYVHKFPEGTSEGTIQAYQQRNRDVLNNPTAAIADYFGTVDISVLQGDARLSEIDDVMHHIRTWWVSSPVPLSLLGYGQDLNRDVLDPQMEQYQTALEGLTPWVEMELVRPLLERQWLLAGIWPAGLEYEVKWKSKGQLTAEALEKASKAVLQLRALGLPDEAVWAILGLFLPGVDLETLLVGTEDEGRKMEADQAPASRVAEVLDRSRGAFGPQYA